MLPADWSDGEAEEGEPAPAESLAPAPAPTPDSAVMPLESGIGSGLAAFLAGDLAAFPAARPPLRPRPPAPRDPRSRGPMIGSGRPKSRLPIHMTPDQVRARVDSERREALEVRDPLAITLAAERYNTIDGVLAPLDPRQPLDLNQPFLSVSQTGKMLGYTAKEVRRLLGQGKIAGRKVGNEWRVPLWAVL